ncbi:MAG: phage major capsid protein [Tardiphaga sp.]
MPAPHYAVKQQQITEVSHDYVLSDAEPDRTGDVIEVKGWEIGKFSPIALFNHNRDAVIGKWENVRVRAGQLLGRLVLADPGTSPIVDMVRALIRQDILETVSVGFRPLSHEPMDKDDPWGARRFTKQELLEASIVAVPANPRARRIMKEFLSDDLADRLFAKSGFVETKALDPTASGKSADRNPSSKGKPMSKIGEGIQQKKNKLVALRDKLAEVAKRAEENDFDVSDEDAEITQTITSEIADTERSLARLEEMERGTMARVQGDADEGDLDAGQRGSGALVTYEHIEPSSAQVRDTPIDVRELGGDRMDAIRTRARNARGYDHLVRLALVNLVAHIERKAPLQVAQEKYGKHRDIRNIETVIKAASAPAMTTVVGWAAELIGSNVQALLDTIRPVSIYPRIAERGVSLNFTGAEPIIIPSRQYGTVPGATAPANRDRRLSGAFVGEGAPIPVRQALFKALTLYPYKMGVISTFTREIANATTPAMEQIIREAIAEDTAWALDQAFLSDEAAVPGVRPAGILNGVTPLTPSTATDPAEAALADVRALMGQIMGVGGGRNLLLVVNPLQVLSLSFMVQAGVFLFRDEIASGRLFGVSMVTSITVPPGDVYLFDCADFASGTGVPVYDVSDQATLHMDDGTYPDNFTAPTVQPIVGGTPTPATPVRSLWQTASIGVRMLMNVSWGMRRPGMVAYMTGVTW